MKSIMKLINDRFPGITSKIGKEHEYLGMNIKFLCNGNVTIDMKSYVKETISASNMGICKNTASPAKGNLFEVDETSEPLNQERKEIFHHCVAKLLYVAKRCRLDIQLTISFLCSRVTKSTEQDWKKLQRLLQYLNGTLDRKFTIGADDITTMNLYIDASYAIHDDMKSHTGGCVVFKRGAVMSKSIKQKLNTKSSTEAELVGTSDYLPTAIYARLFLDAQGYKLQSTTLHQDNESAIKLEKNGRASSGQNTRHVNIRHFFIKDRIDKGEFTVKYCPTELMIADFFNKPLQGNLFRKLSAVVMGEIDLDEFQQHYPPSSQERVENVTQTGSHKIRADHRNDCFTRDCDMDSNANEPTSNDVNNKTDGDGIGRDGTSVAIEDSLLARKNKKRATTKIIMRAH